MTKRLALLLIASSVFVVATVALGASGDYPLSGQGRLFREAQAITSSAPTLSDAGMPLSNVSGYRVRVCANQPTDGGAGALLGTGSLRAYYWDPYSDAGANAWGRDPSLDLSPSTSGLICQTFPDVAVYVPYGRVVYEADTLANDGGSGVTVLIEARTVPK